MKLKLWSDQIEKKDISSFSSLEDFLSENLLSINSVSVLIKDVKDHWVQLIINLDYYYPDYDEIKKESWIRNPFLNDIDVPNHFSNIESGQFIDLITNEYLAMEFKDKSFQLEMFWLKRRNLY